MPEKVIFDYIDSDPLVQVTLINPASNKKVKAYAYLDTGSDTVVVPRELWLKLGLEMLYRSSVCAVGGIVTSWYTRINMEFLKNLLLEFENNVMKTNKGGFSSEIRIEDIEDNNIKIVIKALIISKYLMRYLDIYWFNYYSDI